MEIYVGFDPGGDKRFGWAVCSSKESILHVLATGRAAHTREAVTQALSVASGKGTIMGAGIDAPLFWSEAGGRDVDILVRSAIKQLGAPHPEGTVQHINSLRGACLLQGVMTARLLQKQHPDIALTESHPKALLYLLGIANAERSAASVTMADLLNYVICETHVGEHERDAVLAAITAFAGKIRTQGWINLFKRERKSIIPFNYQCAYWMPWNLIKEDKTT